MDSVAGTPLPKRQKQTHSGVSLDDGDDGDADEGPLLKSEVPGLGIVFSTAPIIINESSPPPDSNDNVATASSPSVNGGRKRAIQSLESGVFEPREKREEDEDFENLLDMTASVPSRVDRVVNLNICNPFLHRASSRHPSARGITLLQRADINGYLKFRLNKQNPWPMSAPQQAALVSQQGNRSQDEHHPPRERIPKPPNGFGSNMKLDFQDYLLWKFYSTAFCPGRTLLSQTNLFLVDYARMGDGNACMRHAILSLAATYVLDYTKEPEWKDRANFHYSKAAKLLSQLLRTEEVHEVGKEDVVVSCLTIMSCEDIITWELRRPKRQAQRWVQGVRSAIQILDQSNPGYLYNDPVNVQNNATRTANQNLIASFEIAARPVMPLDERRPTSKFKWLLYGTRREQRRIHGGTGLSPRLLYMYSQITHLASKIQNDTECFITPHAADRLEKKFHGFRQWSELSEGYASEHDLLNSCILDDKGQVTTRAEVTDLTGQAWVSAAQIYLQCRFFRRPRSHPSVKAPLKTLLCCIERMPCTGTLFTSQSPFFPIFIMGVVSKTAEERGVARVWFEAVLGCRSSVPPVWAALQELWIWMDEKLIEDPIYFDGPIAKRKAWWEQMVRFLVRNYGILSLS